MGITEQSIRAASSEAAHASMAMLLGLRVEWVSIDRDHDGVRGQGSCKVSVRPGDPRPLDELRRALAVTALAQLHFETMAGVASSDRDVEIAYEMAPASADADAWVLDRGSECKLLIRTPFFAAALDGLTSALLERKTLGEREVLGAALEGVMPVLVERGLFREYLAAAAALDGLAATNPQV